MTEAEWMEAIHPAAMVEFLGNNAADRKFRLYTCACCRHSAWHLLTETSRTLVDAAEQFADGRLDSRRLGVIKGKATKALNKGIDDVLYNIWTHEVARKPAASGAWRFTWLINDNKPCGEQCDLARCVFGNPFRPVTVDPSWLTVTALALATGIYEERAFDRIPILADALQDAGCDNNDILNHCRQPGEHVRGCWVVDLILGKS